MPALEVAVGDGSVLAEVLLGDKLVCVKSRHRACTMLSMLVSDITNSMRFLPLEHLYIIIHA